MAGIVLAGGKSARMGRDKALLPWEGKTLLEHAVGQLEIVSNRVIVVASKADQYNLPGVRVVGDRFPDSGPLGGIITGLQETNEPNQFHYVLACDMPQVQFRLFSLLRGFATSERGLQAVIPEAQGRIHPLCAVYVGSAEPILRQRFESGERAVHQALKYLRVLLVTEDQLKRVDPDLTSFINVNAPEDLARLQEGA